MNAKTLALLDQDELTVEMLAQAYPDLVAQISDNGHKAGMAEGRANGYAEGLAAGAQAERERIQAVEKTLIRGHEDLVATLKFDGHTTGAEAAMAVIEAERAKTAAIAAKLVKSGPQSVASAPLDTAATVAQDARAAQEAETAAVPDFMALVEAHQKKEGCTKAQAIRAVAHSNPEAHEAWLDR